MLDIGAVISGQASVFKVKVEMSGIEPGASHMQVAIYIIYILPIS